jgi:hypothetical protein
MITTYFLFGKEATDIYLDNEFDELLEEIDDIHCAVYKHTSGDSVIELINTYDGWGGYAIITEGEYNILKELV